MSTLNEKAAAEAQKALGLPPPPESSGAVKLLGYLAVVVVIVMGVFLVVPQPTPLVDANRQLLAENARDGYCAGIVLIATRGRGSIEQMTDCQAENERSTEKDLDSVQTSFCDGVYIQAGMPKDQCMGIVNTNRFWPTLTGTVTNAWNRSFPYPGSNALDAGVQDESRTGDRDALERSGDSR